MELMIGVVFFVYNRLCGVGQLERVATLFSFLFSFLLFLIILV